MPLLECISYERRGAVTHISIKNHDIQTEKGNLSTRLLHYLANSSFSNMIDCEATIYVASYLPKCLPDKDVLLKLLNHSGKGLLKTIKCKHTRLI